MSVSFLLLLALNLFDSFITLERRFTDGQTSAGRLCCPFQNDVCPLSLSCAFILKRHFLLILVRIICNITDCNMSANISRINFFSFFKNLSRAIRDRHICPFNLKAWHLYSEAHRERYRGVNSIHKRDLSSYLLSSSHPHRSLVCLDFLIARKDSPTVRCSVKISKAFSFFFSLSFGTSGNDAYPESPLFNLRRFLILVYRRKVSDQYSKLKVEFITSNVDKLLATFTTSWKIFGGINGFTRAHV